MSYKHSYTAWTVELESGKFMGMLLEVAGSASFADSEEELLNNLRDAAHCILESNKIDSKLNLENQFNKFGVKHEKMIPCY